MTWSLYDPPPRVHSEYYIIPFCECANWWWRVDKNNRDVEWSLVFFFFLLIEIRCWSSAAYRIICAAFLASVNRNRLSIRCAIQAWSGRMKKIVAGESRVSRVSREISNGWLFDSLTKMQYRMQYSDIMRKCIVLRARRVTERLLRKDNTKATNS